MNECDRSLTDREATRLIEPWRTSPATKSAGDAGRPEQGGIAVVPSRGGRAVVHQGRSGGDEAALVALDHPSSQRVRGWAPMRMKRTGRMVGDRLAVRVGRRSTPGAPRPRAGDVDVRTRPRCSGSRRSDRSGIATSPCRASRRAPASPPAGRSGEEHGGLAGRVGAADDEDVLVATGHRLGHRRAVVDAGAGQALDAGDVELAGRRRWRSAARGSSPSRSSPRVTIR